MRHIGPLSGREPDFRRLRTALLCGQPDCVPALELSHDIAYGQGLMFAPHVMREHLFPRHRRIGGVASRRNLPFLLLSG